jgi:hypothetical protein
LWPAHAQTLCGPSMSYVMKIDHVGVAGQRALAGSHFLKSHGHISTLSDHLSGERMGSL